VHQCKLFGMGGPGRYLIVRKLVRHPALHVGHTHAVHHTEVEAQARAQARTKHGVSLPTRIKLNLKLKVEEGSDRKGERDRRGEGRARERGRVWWRGRKEARVME